MTKKRLFAAFAALFLASALALPAFGVQANEPGSKYLDYYEKSGGLSGTGSMYYYGWDLEKDLEKNGLKPE